MLSSKQIENLKPREKRYTIALGSGLSVKVQPTGTKSFVLRISKDGKVRDIFVGHFPSCTLAQAKQIARRKRKEALLSAPDGYTLSDAFKLWCGLKRGRIVSYQALAKHLHGTELKGRLVAHGLRSIARSWAADSSVPFEVAEACLSHAVGSQVSRAYQRSDFLEARRSVMVAWSAHIADCARSVGMLDGFPWPERDTVSGE